MSFSAVDMEEESGASAAAAAAEEIRRLPAEVNWEMLDKSRFFVLGAALFSGVSAALYPAVLVKTHLQVAPRRRRDHRDRRCNPSSHSLSRSEDELAATCLPTIKLELVCRKTMKVKAGSQR